MLFVPMMCCFLQFAAPERRAAGYVAAVFAGMYAAIILLVYFAKLTTVRFGGLTEQARILLDFRQMNLFFSFDLLGYAMMPMLGVFRADSPAWIGTAVLEFWCAYFCPEAVLSRRYFQKIN